MDAVSDPMVLEPAKTPNATAAMSTAQAMIVRGVWRFRRRPASRLPSAAVNASIEKRIPAARGTSDEAYPSWPRCSGNTGPKLRSTICSPKRTSITSRKFSKARIEVNGVRWRPSAVCGGPGRLPVQRADHDEGNTVYAGGHEKRIPQANGGREDAPDDRSKCRPQTLRRLHGADRRRHFLARGRERRHRDVQRAVARKEPLQDPQRQQMPRPDHVRHRDHDEHEADERALDEQLVAEPIAHAAPQRSGQRGDCGRDAERHAGPDRDVADLRHAQFTDIERQERHHQRVAGKADERGRRDGGLIEFPGVHRTCPSRIRCQAATGSWTKSRQWETQRTLFSSARATVWPAAKVNGVWPLNDAWLRTSL